MFYADYSVILLVLFYQKKPINFRLFNRMNKVEQVGSGIGRISKDMGTIGLPPPVYKTIGLFTVIFKRVEKSSEKITVDVNVKPRVKT